MGRVLVSVEELSRDLGHSDLVVVDCRFSLADANAGERAYMEGHIPGAFYAHLERDLSAPIVPGKTGRHPLPDPHALASRLETFGLNASRRLVAYDDGNGAMAARLWWLVRWLGHEQVAVLDGGYRAWREAGKSVEARIPERQKGDLSVRLRSDLVVDAADVERIRARPDHRVFDARAPERYRGELEPIDRVAGHIPGARSLPLTDNLRGDRFQDAEEVRRRFDVALGGVPPERAVAYCGSGVTACHLVLAGSYAGLDGIRLYAGSWSDWITDPRRPIATGREPDR
ncbi:MAG TPA: sulfurtransferase [Polyangiaceae bacterium]